MNKSSVLRLTKKYTRSNFYMTELNDQSTLTTVKEYDISSSYFYLFRTKYAVRQYQLEIGDVGRPDIISFKAYKSMDYWWIILKYNDIMNPWDELKPEVVLKIPSMRDIQDWYDLVQKQRTKDQNSRGKIK